MHDTWAGHSIAGRKIYYMQLAENWKDRKSIRIPIGRQRKLLYSSRLYGEVVRRETRIEGARLTKPRKLLRAGGPVEIEAWGREMASWLGIQTCVDIVFDACRQEEVGLEIFAPVWILDARN